MIASGMTWVQVLEVVVVVVGGGTCMELPEHDHGSNVTAGGYY